MSLSLNGYRGVMFLGVLCLLCYWNSFLNPFVIDDHEILWSAQGLGQLSFSDLFLNLQNGFYRPVGNLPLWLAVRLFGDSVFGYHVLSLFLLWVLAFVFRNVALYLTKDPLVAFVTAGLFIVNPINGVLVNYISASHITIAMIFSLASLQLFFKFIDSGLWRQAVMSGILFILALLSYEPTVFLPAVFLLYLFFEYRWKVLRSWMIPLTAIAVSLLFLFLRSLFLPLVNKTSGILEVLYDPAAIFSTWASLAGAYIGKIILPIDVIFLLSAKLSSAGWLQKLIIATGTLYLVLALAIRHKKLFFVTSFLVGLALTVPLCFAYHPRVMRPIFEPHWMIVYSLGFFVIMAYAVIYLWRRDRLGKALVFVALIVMVSSCWKYNERWSDEARLSSYWLSVDRGNWTPYYFLGKDYLKRGDCNGAVKVFARSLELNTVVSALYRDVSIACPEELKRSGLFLY